MSSRPSWSTEANSMTGSNATEKLFLEKPKKKKSQKPHSKEGVTNPSIIISNRSKVSFEMNHGILRSPQYLFCTFPFVLDKHPNYKIRLSPLSFGLDSGVSVNAGCCISGASTSANMVLPALSSHLSDTILSFLMLNNIFCTITDLCHDLED